MRSCAVLYACVSTRASLAACDAAPGFSCNTNCMAATQEASSWERQQHADANFSFYAVPSNFSSNLLPGLVLAVEPITNLTNYVVPGGLTMSRIMYTTRDLVNATVPASAYILWPYTPPASSGFPFVAWAHGTTGVLGHCAPSNYRNLAYHFKVPFLVALQGVAVVAPDYAGLGVSSLPSGADIPHPWCAGPAQANDVHYAVVAARAAFPDLLRPDGPFVAMGHSQGGGAVWAFAEKQVDEPLAGYRGTVPMAPTLLLREGDVLGKGPISLLTWRIIASITGVFPAFNYTGLTAAGRDLWLNVIKPTEACVVEHAVFPGLAAQQLFETGWYDTTEAKKFTAMAKNGRKRFRGPMLVIAGQNDSAVPLVGVESAVDDTCALLQQAGWNETLELVTFNSMEHSHLIPASSMTWLAWVKERLAGATLERPGCPVKTVMEGFHTERSVSGIGTNSLVVAAGPGEDWKYAL